MSSFSLMSERRPAWLKLPRLTCDLLEELWLMREDPPWPLRADCLPCDRVCEEVLGPRCDVLVPLCDVVVPLCDVVVPLCAVVAPLCDVVVPLCDVVVPLCLPAFCCRLIAELWILPASGSTFEWAGGCG